jgi:hypothetical protein
VNIKKRIHWSEARIAALRVGFEAGARLDKIAESIKVSGTSVQWAIAAYKIATPEAMERRKEGIVTRQWRRLTPGRIAQGGRMQLHEVYEIAARLGLGDHVEEQPAELPTAPWPQSTLRWAAANPHHREASIIAGEMKRRFGVDLYAKEATA